MVYNRIEVINIKDISHHNGNAFSLSVSNFKYTTLFLSFCLLTIFTSKSLISYNKFIEFNLCVLMLCYSETNDRIVGLSKKFKQCSHSALRVIFKNYILYLFDHYQRIGTFRHHFRILSLEQNCLAIIVMYKYLIQQVAYHYTNSYFWC